MAERLTVRGAAMLLALSVSGWGCASRGVPETDSSPGPAAATRALTPCGDAPAGSWIAETAARIRQDDLLLSAAVAELGPPNGCEGGVTQVFDGSVFGVVVFRFEGAAVFELETMPPAVSVASLRAPEGFPAEPPILEAVRNYAASLGLSIEWTDPERSVMGEEVTEQFWDPDPGLNGSVSVTRAAGVLVAVRLSMAP